MQPISVLVVEDSAVARELITDALNSDPRLRVIAAVDSAEKALKSIPRLKPDVISMDVRLPGISGIEASRRIMETHPTPIVIVAADLSRETVNNSMNALKAGALAVVEKPTIDSAEAYAAMARSLCDQFVNMSSVPVVRQRFNNRLAQRSPVTTPLAAGAPHGAIEIVGIVTSTGGPPATARVLQDLGPSFGLPVLIVQHMGAGFLEGYANWLDTVCEMDVRLARDGETPSPGCVYVGAGRHHLTYEAGRMRLTAAWEERGHVPNGDVLLNSIAQAAGPRAIGVVMTGMGDDGARGLLAMREAGAYTIGQDEATSAVYGMPAVARSIGAVDEELPLDAIGKRITRLVHPRPSVPPRDVPRRAAS